MPVLAITNKNAPWQAKLSREAFLLISHWTWECMVEAGGVEPPSENASTGTSPGAGGYSGSLALPVPLLTGKPTRL